MEPNYTVSSEPAAKGNQKLFYVFMAVAIVVAGLLGWKATSTALAQPEKSDFKLLDYQRQAIDTSVEAYSHMLTDYSQAYTNAYLEDRGDEEKVALKQRVEAQFKQEAKIGRDRLDSMAKSVAMKDVPVKTSFDDFKKQYESVYTYYDARLSNLNKIIESVSGPCAKLTKLNVAKASHPDAYVSAAETCLSAIANTKQGSDKYTGVLLSGVEDMVREQRDKFKEVSTTEGYEQSALKMLALLNMLGTNDKVAAIQTAYEESLTKEYNALAQRVNASNKALEEALAKKFAVSPNKEMARG